jgi:tagatose 1,6-diphosphate aldolase
LQGLGLKEKISGGKRKGLEAVSDSRGIIAAVAIDQRSALRSLFARAMGIAPENVPAERLVQFKEAVSRILTPHASAVLLDPEYGLRAARQRAKSAGLLLAYEKTGYDKNAAERLPRLLDHWSAQRLAEAGADGVKVLLYYSNVSSSEINGIKQVLVERVGAECAAVDIPFFLELVSYVPGLEEKSIEFARAKPAVVTAGMAEFSKPGYRVDVLKVGIPVDLAYVEKSPAAGAEVLYTRQEAKGHFLRASEASCVPFLYLSEGVSNATFQFGLELAAEAGTAFSGVLCGRATWKDGVAVLVGSGMAALEDWLAQEGVRNIESTNRHLHAATPWSAFHRVSAAG